MKLIVLDKLGNVNEYDMHQFATVLRWKNDMVAVAENEQ